MDTSTNTAADSLAEILHALRGIRAPIQQGEYDLQDLVRASLAEAEIPCAHEVPLAPRCRIDLLCPGGIGIEINEMPVLAPRSKEILAEGMVFALEPKFVIPGVGAVGIENSFAVTAGGLEKLTLLDEGIVPLA